MTRLKNCLLACAGVIALAATLVAVTPAGRGFAQRLEETCVRVCEPIPIIARGVLNVAGDVKITNTEAIKTAVEGGVVVNTNSRERLWVHGVALLPSDVFQKDVDLKLPGNVPEITASIPVPAGKMLLIKSVTGSAISLINPHVSIKAEVSEDTIQSFVLPKSQSGFAPVGPGLPPVPEWNVGGGALLIAAAPGSQVEVVFKRSIAISNAGPAALHLTLSGEYVDAAP